MNYGLYLSAAGTLTSMHKQDVLANNLANLNTVGFKPDFVAMRSRLPERLESGTSDADPQLMLEQLGGGKFVDPTRVNFIQGDLNQSGGDLDVAIQGEGFFVVNNGKGSSIDNQRFTRDGRLTLNTDRELVLAVSGLRVMDVNDQPIKLTGTGQIRIDSDGSIIQNNAKVGQLQVSTVADKTRLAKEGDNLLRFTPAGARSTGRNLKQPATGSVQQGFTEASAVDPILALNDMINASKAVQANATMMQYQDNIIGQAVNTLGKVT